MFAIMNITELTGQGTTLVRVNRQVGMIALWGTGDQIVALLDRDSNTVASVGEKHPITDLPMLPSYTSFTVSMLRERIKGVKTWARLVCIIERHDCFHLVWTSVPPPDPTVG